jgi:hypothetical protein
MPPLPKSACFPLLLQQPSVVRLHVSPSPFPNGFEPNPTTPLSLLSKKNSYRSVDELLQRRLMPDLPDQTSEPQSHFLIYRNENGTVNIDVRFENETVWLSQQLMADLFETTKQNISQHLRNIFDDDELSQEATVKEYFTVRFEGQRQVSRPVDFYNLDAIISVGYRVRSSAATQFRIWATERLREYIIKGFVLDDERLKNPKQPFDYFDELLRRIQDIRTSEKRFYQKITDIYATSIDYDPTRPESIEFFQTVQNKLHWAITGQTAAEIIRDRADSAKPNMGLTVWRGAKVRKDDVTIAKNYLNEPELAALSNLVEQYLVFAEGQAMRRVPMKMTDWIEKLHGFLSLNDREILTHAGRVSAQVAKDIAELEYEKFNRKRIQLTDAEPSDFDRAIKSLPHPVNRPTEGDPK